MSVPCGESLAPTATRAPRSSATERSFESARTTISEERSWSLSRIAIALALRPSARAARSVSIHASGEFQAQCTAPERCAATWRS